VEGDTVLFDTDVLIWVQRGNKKAARIIESTHERTMSILTYMELMQCPISKDMQRIIKSFVSDFDFVILPLTENIGHRAAIYIEQYSLSTGMRAGDAIIAATAVENNIPLVTANKKHFKDIAGLELKIFTP
jgi:predicted nucleic acid-binding protein